MMMQRYKQAHTNMSISGWEDARIKGNTHESEDMRMQGYQQACMNLMVWGCENARIQVNTHKPGNMT